MTTVLRTLFLCGISIGIQSAASAQTVPYEGLIEEYTKSRAAGRSTAFFESIHAKEQVQTAELRTDGRTDGDEIDARATFTHTPDSVFATEWQFAEHISGDSVELKLYAPATDPVNGTDSILVKTYSYNRDRGEAGYETFVRTFENGELVRVETDKYEPFTFGPFGTDTETVSEFTYDAADRLVTEIVITNPGDEYETRDSSAYSYNADGRLVSHYLLNDPSEYGPESDYRFAYPNAGLTVLTDSVDSDFGAEEISVYTGGGGLDSIVNGSQRDQYSIFCLATGAEGSERTYSVSDDHRRSGWTVRYTFGEEVVSAIAANAPAAQFTVVNPVNSGDQIRLGGSLPAGATATLFEITGRSLGSWNLDASTSFRSPATAPGLYLLRVSAPGHADATRKLVIR